MKKVLVIDDSTVWRNFLQNFIEAKGHSVEVAKDGLDGINKFFSFLPDIVIVDYVMPKLNGIHFTRFIRSYRAARNVGVLMLTGAEETVNPFWAKKSGVDLFLKKTAPQDEIERTILNFINQPFNIEWSREIYKIHLEPYGELVDIIEESLKESTLVREIISYSEFIYDEELVLRKLHELFSELFEYKSLYIGVSVLSELRLYSFSKEPAAPEEVYSVVSNFTGVKYYSHVETYFDGKRKLSDKFMIEIIYQKDAPVGFIIIEEPHIIEVTQQILSMINTPLGVLFTLLNDYKNLSAGKEIDEVTGLYNETAFRAKVMYALDFAKRNNIPLTFAKVKLKNLKDISAAHGEMFTNRLLREIGNYFSKKVPDLSARLSSDQFVCILLGSNKQRAELQKQESIEKIKEILVNFDNLKLEFECSIVEWNGETLGEIMEKL
ncbi:MAG: response regulator [Fervidobacterium sp.]|nr:response regulator [Fervidobacterium sp.]